MTVKFEYGTDYNLVWRVMGAGFFLLLLFGYWNHKIQQAKKIIEKQNKELEILAMTDKLTGVYNRSKLDEILQAQIDSSNRYNQTFGCAIIDIDYFKEVNDVHGHLIGDRVLVEIANLINRSLRKSDIFGRWGGEEFLIIAPAVNKESFLQLLSKVLEIVSSYEIEAVGKKTISIGATICLEKDTEDNLIKRADDALYRAKNSGRNQVVIYE
jgi:polar amino acid transport system substrate-binding protein